MAYMDRMGKSTKHWDESLGFNGITILIIMGIGSFSCLEC